MKQPEKQLPQQQPVVAAAGYLLIEARRDTGAASPPALSSFPDDHIYREEVSESQIHVHMMMIIRFKHHLNSLSMKLMASSLTSD